MGSIAAEYAVEGIVQESDGATAYRARRLRDGATVGLKALRPERPSQPGNERLRREREIGRRLDSSGVVGVHELTTWKGQPALELEGFGDTSLDRLLGAPMPPERALRIAVQLASALSDIHASGVIHRDVKPANVFVDTASDTVKITNFGISSVMPTAPAAPLRQKAVEGSLAYMSPEQTGRANRAIDWRTDLYSLGVTLYEMLTGRLPFQASDPLEWVHCHLARAPTPLAELVRSLPPILSDIVMKLLAKMPEDRYQSARGLAHDLVECLSRLESTGEVEPFPLGQDDISERFQIPQKLYGRREELGALRAAFERVAASGTPELVLVSGYSGIGKSALVNELSKPIARARGFFGSGKVDQQERGSPYSSVVRAFRELVQEILGQSEARIGAWRERLRAALGPNGRLIIDLIPQVELILGPQPPVPELPPPLAQSRFQTVFRRFIEIFTQPQHPLALFLDDLQWVDSATLMLLLHVATHPETHHLLVLGAYRENEVGPSHPLRLAVDAMRMAHARISTIALGPLSLEHLTELVADTVHRSVAEALPLAQIVHARTAGNPFFATQFLGALHQEGLIVFEARTRGFRWDVAEIAKQGYTDNVVDLMVGKIKRLAGPTQDAMKLAAALGSTADAVTLSVVRERSLDETHADLEEAVREGLLSRSGDAYGFLHDRVQQAAYALIPEGERAGVHLFIGRLLLLHTPPEEVEARVFELVGHLNRGAEQITDPHERERLAEIELVAGRRARASAAYAQAASYLATGTALLGEIAWSSHHAMAFALHGEHAWCAFLSGDFAAAEQLIEALFRHASSRLELAEVHRIEIALCITKGEYERGARSALTCLHRFGIDLPLRPTREEVKRAVQEVRQELRGRSIESLVDLPPMVDPDMKAAAALLSAGSPAAYYTDTGLSDLLTCHVVRISLQHGNTDPSSLGYAMFGALLGNSFGLYQEGYRFGKLARALADAAADGSKARVLCSLGNFVNHWIEPYRDVLKLHREVFDLAVATGDLPIACFAAAQIVGLRIIAGDDLDDVAVEAEKRHEFTCRAQCDDMRDSIALMLWLVRSLRGTTPEPPVCGGTGPPTTVFVHHFCDTIRRFIYGDYAGAAAGALAASEILWAVQGQVPVSEHSHYAALASAAVYDSAPPEKQRELLETVRAREAELRALADVGPANHRGRHALVAAELARITGADREAMRLYEQAIRWARVDGFTHNEAIGCEVAARFYRARGIDWIADAYLREARAVYARWGAAGKVQDLDRHHPDLGERGPLLPTTTFVVQPEQLDLLSVVKASQGISSEMLLPKLCETLMRIVLEQAGAQRGALIMVSGAALTIQANAVVDREGARVDSLQEAPVSPEALPLTILRYVARTREPVVLNDAAASARFSTDEYIARCCPRSILCLPIVRQGRVAALLYLENNLATGAFTADKLGVLELIGGQAAISLDNATLYSDLRRSKAELQAVIDNMIDGVVVADRSGRISLVNRAALRLLGFSSPEQVGSSIAEAVRHIHLQHANGTPYEPEDMPLFHAIRGEEVALVEGTLERPEPEMPRHLHGSAAPMRDEHGEVVGAVAVWRDVTELVELDRLKDQFLRVAAHELKTPVTVIKGYAETLQRLAPDLPPKQRQMVDAILRGTRRIDRIVADLLYVSLAQIGRLDLVAERIDLGDLIQRVATRLAKTAPAHRIRITQTEAVVVQGDRQLLEQVLSHLIDNAIRYSPEGGDVDVGLGLEDGQQAVVTVRDHGVGIPRHKQARIFESFYRAHTDTPHDYGGMGTGLYLSRAIVARHKGDIGFESEPGVGSTFRVRLPVSPRGAPSPS